jgi:glyceraldehyde-3-phosphate dehydrogenase (NAD(P))
MRDLERPRGDMWEVAVWEDALAADDRDLYLTYQVHNEAIVVPENIDCIRALTGLETEGPASIWKTDGALGITKTFLPATTRPISPPAGAAGTGPAMGAVRAAQAGLTAIGFTGAEEPAELVLAGAPLER